MDWQTVEEAGLPPLQQVVFVETKEGSWLFGRRVTDHVEEGKELWRDNSGCIIWSPIVRWAHVVSPDATDAK